MIGAGTQVALKRHRPAEPRAAREGLDGAAASPHFLEAHLNLQWLRPESALWDAIASFIISRCRWEPPAMDLGAGNGLFSFITAGGEFSQAYDWYRNVDLQKCSDGQDAYDTCIMGPQPEWIIRSPARRLTCALDVKPALLRQAQALEFYEELLCADANRRLPCPDEAFQTVFSNILSWLTSPRQALKEIHRVLRPGGRAILCVPSDRFLAFCVSYQWRRRRSTLLRLINHGRSGHLRWMPAAAELRAAVRAAGFRIAAHVPYLSPLTLRVWDIGLRPFSAALIATVQRLSEADRLAMKREWLDAIRPFARELYELDRRSSAPGGFQCLEAVKG